MLNGFVYPAIDSSVRPLPGNCHINLRKNLPKNADNTIDRQFTECYTKGIVRLDEAKSGSKAQSADSDEAEASKNKDLPKGYNRIVINAPPQARLGLAGNAGTEILAENNSQRRKPIRTLR
jgi:hypothetical protein